MRGMFQRGKVGRKPLKIVRNVVFVVPARTLGDVGNARLQLIVQDPVRSLTWHIIQRIVQ